MMRFWKQKTLVSLLLLMAGKLTAQNDQSIDELFNMSFDELMRVDVVTASKIPQSLGEIPASVVIMDAHDIERFGYQSVEEILINVPGMYLIDDYLWLGSKNFGMRGFFSTGAFNNIVVLINGINLKSDVLYSAYPTEKINVPVESIERIEIIRGPMSVIYGSGAFLGAINIITQKEDQAKREIRITGTVGQVNTKKGYAGVSGPRFSFNGEIYQDDGFDVPFNKIMSDPSIATRPAHEGGWNLTSEWFRLKTRRKQFDFSFNSNDFTFYFRTLGSEKNVVESVVGAGEGSVVYYNASLASIGYRHDISPRSHIKGQFNYFFEHHWVDNEFMFDHAYSNNWARMNGVELDLVNQFTLSPRFQLQSGFNARHVYDFCVVADYPTYQLADVEVDIDGISTFAFYTQCVVRIRSSLKLIAGLRFEKPEPYQIVVAMPETGYHQDIAVSSLIFTYDYAPTRRIHSIPRLAVVMNLGDNHILKAMAGKAIKEPSSNANLDLVFSQTSSLKAAEISTLELNYVGAVGAFLTANISIFRNDLNRLISRLNVLDPEKGMIIVSSNAGQMKTTGLELGVNCRLTSHVALDLSALFQRSRNERPGFESIDLGYSPSVLGYGKFHWSVSSRCSASLTGRYVGRMQAGWNMDATDAKTRPIIDSSDPYQGRLGYAVPARFVLDGSVRFNQVFDMPMDLTLALKNVFNEAIYYPTTTSNPQFDLGTMGQGRRFLLSLDVHFQREAR